eukprot:8907404-Alexandrium_andersonii.AAC.1
MAAGPNSAQTDTGGPCGAAGNTSAGAGKGKRVESLPSTGAPSGSRGARATRAEYTVVLATPRLPGC